MAIDERLAELGIKLPTPAKPVANYAPMVILDGDLVYVSGQLPLEAGRVAVTGRLGEDVDVANGQIAARLCFLNILAQVQATIPGGLDAITKIVRLGGFVAAAPTFADHAQVMNGASDLAVALYGDAGRHARSTVGVASLPLNAAVEVEALLKL